MEKVRLCDMADAAFVHQQQLHQLHGKGDRHVVQPVLHRLREEPEGLLHLKSMKINQLTRLTRGNCWLEQRWLLDSELIVALRTNNLKNSSPDRRELQNLKGNPTMRHSSLFRALLGTINELPRPVCVCVSGFIKSVIHIVHHVYVRVDRSWLAARVLSGNPFSFHPSVCLVFHKLVNLHSHGEAVPVGQRDTDRTVVYCARARLVESALVHLHCPTALAC